MRSEVRRKLEMAARVRQFSRTHPSSEPGYATLLGSLEERLTRAEAIAARQHDGLASARSARAHRRELRRELHSQVLPHLIRVGVATGKNQPDLAKRFVLPSSNVTYKTYLTAATAMINLAETHRDILVSKGLTGSALEDLRRIVTEFEAATELARAGRIEHIGARTDLDVVTVELMEIVRVLDGINRYRFGKDPEAMAGWIAAKHVPGTPSSKTAPSLPTPATKPSTGDVAPAA